ncbi:MAG: DUF4430 domain-containing protein [Bacillota bacterium]|nr:DUF4430 domain-containing protein [Bacillota bacterium]
MKRIVKMMILLFVLVLSFSLIGCSSTSEPNKEKQESKAVKTTETAKIKSVKASNKTKSAQTVTQKKSNQVNTKTNIVTSKQSPTNVMLKNQPTTASKQSKADVQKTSTPKTSTMTKSNQVPLNTVTLSITGPKDHKGILSSSKVTIKGGETIFDVLLHATKNAGIQVDYDGGGATAYVNGIDNIYEFDYGPKSGWMFKLNGVSITKSSGLVKIKAGDRIECYYTQ